MMKDYKFNTNELASATASIELGGELWSMDLNGNAWRYLGVHGKGSDRDRHYQRMLRRVGLDAEIVRKNELKSDLFDPDTGNRVILSALRTTKGRYTGYDFAYLVVDDKVYPTEQFICTNIYQPRKGFWLAGKMAAKGYPSDEAMRAHQDRRGIIPTKFDYPVQWVAPGPVDRKKSAKLRNTAQKYIDFHNTVCQLSGERPNHGELIHQVRKLVDEPEKYPYAKQIFDAKARGGSKASLLEILHKEDPDLSTPERVILGGIYGKRILNSDGELRMANHTVDLCKDRSRSTTKPDYLLLKDK